MENIILFSPPMVVEIQKIGPVKIERFLFFFFFQHLSVKVNWGKWKRFSFKFNYFLKEKIFLGFFIFNL